MRIDSTSDAASRIEKAAQLAINHTREGTHRKFSSGWVRIDASASADFTHNLRDIPIVVSVIASDSPTGTSPSEASSVTVTKTDKIVTVANGGTARFFKVRAI